MDLRPGTLTYAMKLNIADKKVIMHSDEKQTHVLSVIKQD